MIENDWIPEYAPSGFSAAAIYCGESPAFGQFVARHADVRELSMPWDIEFEVFDRYRIPGVVFPLRVLVDRDGTVLEMFTGEELDETQAAVEAAL